MDAPETSILDMATCPYCRESTRLMMCPSTRKMIRISATEICDTIDCEPAASTTTSPSRFTGTEKNTTIALANAAAYTFLRFRCSEVSAALCHTKSFGPGAGFVRHDPKLRSTCTCPAITASICRENTTSIEGDGDSSVRYSYRALSNALSAAASASRAASRSFTAQSRFARSFVTAGSFRGFAARSAATSAAEAWRLSDASPSSPPSSASNASRSMSSSRFRVGSRPKPPRLRTASASASCSASCAPASRISACKCLSLAACHLIECRSSARTSRAGMQLTTHPSPSTASSFIFVDCTISVLVHARKPSSSSGMVWSMNARTALAFRFIHFRARAYAAMVAWSCSAVAVAAASGSRNEPNFPRPSRSCPEPPPSRVRSATTGLNGDDGDANLGEFSGVPRRDPAPVLVPLFDSALLMALRSPTSSFMRAMLSGSGSVVSMGMSLTTTAWLLMPSRFGPSFQMSRAYALVSRVSKYMSQNEHAHVSAMATQNTVGFDAASSVNRRMPLVLVA